MSCWHCEDNKKKAIAIAVYSDSLYTKELYSEKEIKAIEDSTDEEVGDDKCVIIRSNLTVEDHT